MKTVYIVIMFWRCETCVKAVFSNAQAALTYVQRWGTEITHNTGLFNQLWSNGVNYFTINPFQVKDE